MYVANLNIISNEAKESIVRLELRIILSTIFISCKDTDNSVFGDDFDFPVLTDANTIRFTVNVTGDWRQLNIVADGGRMVIDWGNGRMQKVEDPSRGWRSDI